MGSAARRTWLRGERGWRLAVACGCVALLALWLSHGLAPLSHAELASRRTFPHRAPSDIAHRLADFSTLPHAIRPLPGSWRVEEERGNLSLWRYHVTWACGTRCSGAAAVSAHADADAHGALSHAHANRHRVHLHVRTCTDDALLPWWADCDEMEITAEVVPDGAGGAMLREEARAVCSTWGDEVCAVGLHKHRSQHHALLAQAAYV